MSTEDKMEETAHTLKGIVIGFVCLSLHINLKLYVIYFTQGMV